MVMSAVGNIRRGRVRGTGESRDGFLEEVSCEPCKEPWAGLLGAGNRGCEGPWGRDELGGVQDTGRSVASWQQSPVRGNEAGVQGLRRCTVELSIKGLMGQQGPGTPQGPVSLPVELCPGPS